MGNRNKYGPATVWIPIENLSKVRTFLDPSSHLGGRFLRQTLEGGLGCFPCISFVPSTRLIVKALDAAAHFDKNLTADFLPMLFILELCEFLEELLKRNVWI